MTNKAVLKIKELNCVNCIVKIENGVQKLLEIEEANVAFMTQKMTIVADDDKMNASSRRQRRSPRRLRTTST